MVQTKKQCKAPAFTLIELVVVITILAILGTIGFLSVGGYSSRARDSGRAADVAQVSKSLDLSIISAGSYPTPDNYFTVTYSGGAVWYQGTVSNGVIQKLHTSISGGGLDSKPTDPLNGMEFTYSSLAFGKAYQIKTVYEGDAGMALADLAPEAFAAPGSPTAAFVKGNYGGLTAKTVTGSTTYVLAVPSIVTGTGAAVGSVLEISSNSLSGTLLFNGKNLVGASSFNPNVVIFSGAALPTNDSSGQITNMMGVLKTAYSGSDLAAVSNISTLLNTATGGLANLGGTVLTSQLGGTTSSSTTSAVNGICGSANGAATGSTPVSGLCNAGNPSAVTGSGPWAWTCVGTNGGTTANCSANKTQANPTGLAVSHSSRSKTFTFSWTAGSGNGGVCKIQYLRNGSTWTDVSATTYNCDTTLSNQSVTLPADGWYTGNWNGAQLRAMRTNDGANLGVFPQTLSCSSAGGSASSTPSIDEDCNGTWDNTTSSSTCNTCSHPGYAGYLDYYHDSSCTMPDISYSGCESEMPTNKGCGPQDGRYSIESHGGYGSCTVTDANCGACGVASTTTTYY